MPATIHQSIVLPASPERVYAVLTNASEFSKATGNRAAEIASGEGGTFTLFGGAIHGRHIELIAGKRVVQAWRAQNWEPGTYSLVRFTLSPDGSGTRVVLDHSSFPDGEDKHLDPGWHANYWEPLTKYLS